MIFLDQDLGVGIGLLQLRGQLAKALALRWNEIGCVT